MHFVGGLRYSVLSKRLKKLIIDTPFYRYAHKDTCEIKSIAIDSSGLKICGQDEWHEEKYGKNTKKDWRKRHISVDDNNIIQTSVLTNSNTQDTSMVNNLIEPITSKVKCFVADKAYDNNKCYRKVRRKFPNADVVIPPQKNSVYDKANEFHRNRNIEEVKCYGAMGWQKLRHYGKRNNSELAIQRYKKILGNKMHSRDFARQKLESQIGCGILNKMMAITLEEIRQAA